MHRGFAAMHLTWFLAAFYFIIKLVSDPKLLIILFVLILFAGAFLIGSEKDTPREIFEFLKTTWDLKTFFSQ